MIRWLLAVFTLQFLLGIGVSAYAQTTPVESAWTAAVQHVDQAAGTGTAPCAAAQDLQASPEMPGDYDVDFNGADLPDDQEFRGPRVARPTVRFSCPWLAGPAAPSQPPHEHLRPPRA